MKQFLIGGALVLSMLGFSPSVSIAQGKIEQELMQIENDWCTAEVKRDATMLGRILAEDFTSVGNRGTSSTKSQDLASLKDMTTSVGTCVNANMKVRVYGDAAVVTGLVTRSGTYKGVAYKDRQVLFTDTYVRRDGRWQCVATQGTLVAAQLSQKLLQVNLKFNIPGAEIEAAWLEGAQPIADWPGLLWKVWLMNESEREAGGIYLFESDAAAQSYLAGPIMAAAKSSPVISNISAKLFDVLERHTAITRGPVK